MARPMQNPVFMSDSTKATKRMKFTAVPTPPPCN